MEYIINPINGEKYSIHDVNGRNLLKMYLLTYKSGGMFSFLDLIPTKFRPWISQKNDVKRRLEELTNFPDNVDYPITHDPKDRHKTSELNNSVKKRLNQPPKIIDGPFRV